MKLQTEGSTTFVDAEGSEIEEVALWLEKKQEELIKQNVVLNLSGDQSLNVKKLSKISPFAKFFKKQKRSFVIIAKAIDFNAVPQTLNVVPTLQEAKDIIEMEEIERDLGF